jgi:hypothetical protein
MHDAAEIVAVLERAYEALDFEPGSEPDWTRFNSAFAPEAILALRVFPEDEEVSVLTLRDYAREQLRNHLGDHGYSETPGARQLEIVGDIAWVRQEFTMNFADREPVEAIDVFTLACRQGQWRVVAVGSDLSARIGPGRRRTVSTG